MFSLTFFCAVCDLGAWMKREQTVAVLTLDNAGYSIGTQAAFAKKESNNHGNVLECKK